MQPILINGTTLEYEVTGSGEPVLLIHGSHIADAFAPMCAEPRLRDRHQLIQYHRRGFAGSARHSGPCSIPQQAEDARALMAALGVQKAHIVGHSYGGGIALALAVSAPTLVHSLALLEPAGLPVPSVAGLVGPLTEAGTLYASGKRAEAIDQFMRAVVDPDAATIVPRVLPHAEAQAIADAATFFEVEVPALGEWGLTQEQAARFTMPVLSVLGSRSGDVWKGFAETHAMLQQWLPNCEGQTLVGVTHLLEIADPSGAARILADFFVRHPIAK